MTHANIHLKELERGPIRHKELPPELLVRISDLCATLQEVFPAALEDWLDDFRRDHHPEAEVAWWERLAQSYRTYRDRRDLTAAGRLAAFKILFTIGLGDPPETLTENLASLPTGALADLQAIFRERGE